MYLVVERSIKRMVYKPAFRIEAGEVRDLFGRYPTFKEAGRALNQLLDQSFGRGRTDFWNDAEGALGASYASTQGGSRTAAYLEVVEEGSVELPSWCRRKMERESVGCQ